MADTANLVNKHNGADGEDAIPFCGCVCCFSACYTSWPQCFGCSGNCNCLCYHSVSKACKFPNPEDPDDKDIWFLCSRGDAYLGDIKNICSSATQCFCLDYRLSVPPIDEIPCMITICFFTLVYKSKNVMQFFKSLKDLEAEAAKAT
eukprot:scaffold3349_cov165-Ochromonas_danica.AAC.4